MTGHLQGAIGTGEASLYPSCPAGTVVALQREPISPELVLVDPELAQRERARLEEEAKLKAFYDVEALRRAVAIEAPPSEEPRQSRLGWREAGQLSRRRLLQGALLCSLLANGFLAAELVSRIDSDATPAAVRMVTLTESAAALTTSPAAALTTSPAATLTTSPAAALTSSPASSIPEPAITTTQRQEQKQSRKLLETKASVERKLILWIVAAPARKLPARFVDRKTGLVKNNVQAACRRETRSFLCVVRLASDERKGGIHIRYRVTRKGKEVFQRSG